MTALEIAQRALELAGADAEVVVHSERSGMARFAASEVHQPTLIANTTVQVRVAADGKVGSAVTNRIDDDGLAAVVARAHEGAAPEPGFAGFAGAAEIPPADGYDDATANLSAARQASLAAAAFDVDLPVYGFFTSGVTELAVATAAGLAAEQRLSDAAVRVLAATDGASGWAEQTSWRVADVDPAAAAREAAEKAARTRGAAEPEPQRFRAVLEPYAIAELLQWFAFSAFNGLALLEERSFLAGRLDERVFDPKVTLHDDQLATDGLPRRFDFEGTPTRRLPLVEEGVGRGVAWDRRTAARAQTRSTGHARPPAERAWGPFPSALRLSPGDAESVDELAELVGDGIYVTRVHYLGIVQPREGVLTGMTRDGTFRIRDGKVAEPLVNLRFTVSMPELLADVLGLTRATKLVSQSDFYDDRHAIAARVPALASGNFNVTGTGSAPGL
jgi:predicted Zn-dependent protease